MDYIVFVFQKFIWLIFNSFKKFKSLPGITQFKKSIRHVEKSFIRNPVIAKFLQHFPDLIFISIPYLI